MRGVDYNKETYIKESIMIMYYTKGGVTKKDIDNMSLDEIDMYLKEVSRIQSESMKGIEDNDIRHGRYSTDI